MRRAKESDLESIAALNQLLFQHDSPYDPELDFSFPSSLIERHYFRSRIIEDDALALFATKDGEAIGYLVAAITPGEPYRNAGPMAELENMLVIERHRSKGLGAQLVSEFFKWCEERKIKNVKVQAYAGNDEAIKFYKRNGFQSLSVSLERKIER